MKLSTKILITGAAGLLGQRLVAKLADSCKILAIDIASNPFGGHDNLNYLQRDLTEFIPVKPIIDSFAPEIIFNCASLTDVDDCEKKREIAYKINVGLVESLLQIKAGRFIHFSSDYIFNGRGGPYSETDAPDPLGYYGETKLISERILIESGRPHLIIRTNVIFGTGVNIKPNFITWLIDNLKKGINLKIVTDQHNNPVHAGNLADVTIEAAAGDLTGILNLAGASYLSRYEIAIKTAAYFKLDAALITPITSRKFQQPAIRPLNAGLKIDKAAKLLKTRLLTFDEALKLMDYEP
jgi:dTDP-4-dehydrorhamnose reductase